MTKSGRGSWLDAGGISETVAGVSPVDKAWIFGEAAKVASTVVGKRNLSAYTNFLRAKYDMYTGAARVRSYPYYISIEPSDICQLRCPTCPTGIENESRRRREQPLKLARADRQRMTPELYAALLDELGEYLFLVNFYNYGEPLLNRHLPAFIRRATALDIESVVHTNLSLRLSDEQVDALMDSGLARLTCSVDGFTQAAYEVHRVGGDVELVKGNLERLARARDRLGSKTEITYKYLVFSHNEHELEAAQRYAESIGVSFERNEAFVSDPRWLPSYRWGEAPQQTRGDMDRVAAEWALAGRPGYFRDDELSASWSPIPKQLPSVYPGACAWHYSYSVVSAGGAVAPCCAAAKEEDDFGTVRPGQSSFREVWNGDAFVRSRLAFAGREPQDLDRVDTLCLRCYFPKFIHHLYTPYDVRVSAQAQALFSASHPALARAFALLEGTPVDARGFASLVERELADVLAAPPSPV